MKAVLYQSPEGRSVHDFTKDFSDLDWTVVTAMPEAEKGLAGAEILLIANPTCTPELGVILNRVAGKSLRWIHFLSSGIDRAPSLNIPAGVRLSNTSSIKAPTISEHALTMLMALHRRLPEFAGFQSDRKWERGDVRNRMTTLHGSTVCVVGLGSIGRAFAQKAHVLGARVIAVSRAGAMEGVIDATYPREKMREAFAISDSVAVCTSLETDNRHMIGEAELAGMKTGAYLINIARGALIDESALVAALRSGKLGGAGLDVATQEPLPADHPLWGAPNLILTPHVSNSGPDQYRDQKKLFGENLARFREGRPLLDPCEIPGRI
jgi:D-2-hydroxyacid dehydrogenase (NADP+)